MASTGSARLSACLVILRPLRSMGACNYQVLLIRRAKTTTFAPNLWAFPGGGWDAPDGACGSPAEKLAALVTTARRESFEETGVLPFCEGKDVKMAPAEWREWRHCVHQDPAKWVSFLESLEIREDEMALAQPLCCFLTPEAERLRSGRQYETHFFLTSLSEHAQSHTSTAEVDQHEIAEAVWVEPPEALRQHQDGKLNMLPPQFHILTRLSQFSRLFDVLNRRDHRFWEPQQGTNQLGFVMQPEFIGKMLVLPFDEKHSCCGSTGARHRIHGFRNSTSGMSLEINNLVHHADQQPKM